MNIKTHLVNQNVFFLILLLVGCRPAGAQNQVCFPDHCFKVEVVEKNEDRRRGLQFRKSLSEDAGMLFVFETSYPYSFWMKDTLIPLDMIWLDYARRVVHIESHVPPCRQDPCATYTPSSAALYVLEISAGQAEKMGLSLNAQAEFRLSNP